MSDIIGQYSGTTDIIVGVYVGRGAKRNCNKKAA